MQIILDLLVKSLTNKIMIVKEYYNTRNDGVRLSKTYSDIQHYIRKVGTEEVYSEAIDVENSGYEYEETNELIEEEKAQEPLENQ